MKKNNFGYSIVELMVVIAILAIVSSSVVAGLGLVRDNDVKRANTTVRSVLNNTKTYCLSKKSADITFFREGDDLYYEIRVNEEVIKKEKIGGKRVRMAYYTATQKGDYQISTPGVVEVTAGEKLTISFEHSTGGLKTYNGTENTYVYRLFLYNTTTSGGIEKPKKVYAYEFTPITGRFELSGK